MLASPDDTKRRAGVQQLDELRQRSLEECDRLAGRMAASARMISLLEGAVTGAGGVLTTLLDIPLLFVLSLGPFKRSATVMDTRSIRWEIGSTCWEY